MGKFGGLALGAVTLLALPRPILANDPALTVPSQAPVVSYGAAANSFCPSCSASYAAHGTCAACPKHGLFRRNMCDEGEGKLTRFCHWLFYVPQKTGCAGVCCNGSIRPQVPFYAYFPCRAGGATACATCSAGQATAAVAHVSDGGEAQSKGATASPVRVSTFKPAAIAKQMPILPPDQFKQPPPKNACDACRR
jgi:hypothetical protein